MQRPQPVYPEAQDIDLAGLGRALWRAKGWILGIAVGVGAITFIALSMMRPLYTSEARVLIQNEESAFTRPAADQGREQQRALDEQAVQSQVQVITSRDLALQVVRDLDLANNPAFQKDAGVGPIRRLIDRLGLSPSSRKSEQEKAADAFAEHLTVFQLAKSSVIAIEYTSGDATLAAQAANKLADVYIGWQRKEKITQTRDATAWLRVQIEELRRRVAESEAAAEKFRADKGLFSGGNNVTLNAQQLSELNSQVILAKAQKSEAEARARLITQMLESGEVDATPEVLKSELISRLIEQRAQVQRQLAELSATLMPSHPRIKQLTSELADIRAQIRDEADKVVKGLENEAAVASARETSLRNSLNDVKSQASGLGDSEIKLRALEREAKANRDLLESYLARYQDASARHDMGAVPAQATIVSRAHASVLPSFPRRVPMTLLVMAATFLLSIAYVMARELMAGAVPVPVALQPSAPPRTAPQSPPASPSISERVLSPGSAPQKVQQRHVMPPALLAAGAASFPQTNPAPHSPASASPPTPRLRPNWLKVNEMKTTKSERAPLSEPAAVPGKEDAEAPAASSSILHRMRLRLQQRESDRRKGKGVAAADAEPVAPAPQLPSTRPNDLRHYLQQRVNAQRAATKPRSAPDAPPHPPAIKAGNGRVGPVLTSLDAVLAHILAAAKGEAPHALLVAAASTKTDAALDAIELARALGDRNARVLLVDAARGASAVSGALGLPRSPGFTDLLADRVGFEDVIRVDPETALQVITAGNPSVKPDGDEVARFERLFGALTQAYDCVVIHADYETAQKLKPALRLELPVMVAVLPKGASENGRDDRLTGFVRFGCPIVVYEQSGRRPRSGFLGRVASF